MPIGTYTVMDGAGHPVGTEEFRASAGPFGWRYVATIRTTEPEPHLETVDLTADRLHRPVRLHVDTGAHRMRLAADGEAFEAVRDGRPVEIPRRDDLDYLSPCFNALTATRLDATAEIEVVYLEPVTLEPRLERQRYERLGPQEVETPVGLFGAEAWRFTALASGWTRRLWVASLLVVAYEDLFRLSAYEPGRSGPHPR